MDKFKGYKTVAFNVLMGLLVVLGAFLPDAVIPSGEHVETTIATIWAIVEVVGNLILRFKTTTKVFKKR